MMRSPQIVLGLGLVALGAVLLLDRLGVLNSDEVIGRWWPVVIIAFGALQFTERRRSPLGPLIVISFGVLLLVTRLQIVSEDVWRYLWPIALIVVGLLLVLRRGVSGAQGGNPDDTVNTTAIFSGNSVISTSQQLRGGSVTAAFGGVTLDLRQARLDPSGATVTVLAVCGGAEVLVPRGWRVVTTGTPMFGGMANKTETPPEADAPSLRVDATVLFGGVEVKHEK
jgi:predicted membrane protein